MESHQNASSKTDRNTIERNRRNHLKNLYSQLNSLVPRQNPKGAISLIDQLDEAANYIKKLEENLERMKEKKEHLMGTEKISERMSSEMMVGLRTPQIEIYDLGSALEVSLISAFDSQFMFYEIIRVLQDEGAEVVNASFTIVEDKFLHAIHAEAGESTLGLGAERISRRLKKFVHECSPTEDCPVMQPY